MLGLDRDRWVAVHLCSFIFDMAFSVRERMVPSLWAIIRHSRVLFNSPDPIRMMNPVTILSSSWGPAELLCFERNSMNPHESNHQFTLTCCLPALFFIIIIFLGCQGCHGRGRTPSRNNPSRAASSQFGTAENNSLVRKDSTLLKQAKSQQENRLRRRRADTKQPGRAELIVLILPRVAFRSTHEMKQPTMPALQREVHHVSC